MNGEQVAAVSIAAIIVWGITLSMWAQAWASRRNGGAKPERLEALESRLERVEQAIDAVAGRGRAHRRGASLHGHAAHRAAGAAPGRVERRPGA